MSETAQFLPFHAINNFMLPEYRLNVIRTVLTHIDQLPGERRGSINQLLKRLLKLPGFRNPSQAPLPIKIKGAVASFEKNPDLSAQIVAGWSELHPEIRQQVHDLLVERGWELLPIETDRARLPGYLTRWPRAETFEAITAAFHEKYSGQEIADDDISLMTVWLSGRLPYELAETDEEQG